MPDQQSSEEELRNQAKRSQETAQKLTEAADKQHEADEATRAAQPAEEE